MQGILSFFSLRGWAGTAVSASPAGGSNDNIVLFSAIAAILVLAASFFVRFVLRRFEREIELRREIEKKLRDTNELLERTGRLAKVGGWELDLVNDNHVMTEEVLRIRDLPPGTRLTGEEALSYYSPEDYLIRRAQHEAAVRDGIPWKTESLLTTATGRKVWVHSHGEAVFQDGKVVKLVGAIQDITDRKLAELDLIKRSKELEMHNRILRQINRGLPLEETLESMAWQIETLHPGMFCAIMLVEGDGRRLHCGAAPRLPDSFVEAIDGLPVKEGAACCGTSACLGELVVVNDLEHHPYFDDLRDIARMAGVKSCWSQPILDYRGSLLGTFAIYLREAVEPNDGEIVLLETYASFAGLVIERHRAEKQIRSLAFYDALTGLPNRRLLVDRLTLAMALSKRTARHGALMFVDLDNFKPLNDAHGHSVGDLLLTQVARRLVACVREMDTVARFGGDEFVVMLTELDADGDESARQAAQIAEKIRMTVAEPYVLKSRMRGGGEEIIEHRCSSSIGVVMFVNHYPPLEEIMRQADAAMYRAKEAGRNTVFFARTELTV